MSEKFYAPYMVVDEEGDLLVYASEDSQAANDDWEDRLVVSAQCVPAFLEAMTKAKKLLGETSDRIIEKQRQRLREEIAERQAQLDALG